MVRPASDAELPEVARLYERCFPPHERPTAGQLHQRVADGLDEVLVCGDGDGEVAGFATLTDLPEADATLLSHLAVDPEARSGGVGGRLLTAAADHARRAGSRWLVIETEPASAQAHPDFGDPRRRLRFYRRHGAVPLAARYAIPDRRFDGARLLDMSLLGLPLGPDDAPQADLSAVRRLVRAAWQRCYGRGPEDPAVCAVVERLRVPAAA